jgi:NAD(P)-dependent dehydrogenase (short-subunit alcohol dehydrogenase family)
MTTALVTGAARGLGLEVSRQLAAAGMRVVLTARSLDAARAAAEGLEGDVVPAQLDVTDRASIDRVVADEAAGGLDVVVSNAAAFPDWSEQAATADLAAADLAWRTNVLGPWNLVQATLPLLRASAAPRIVVVTSGSGSHGEPTFGLGSGPGMASYAVSKAAANALVRKLAADLPGILVNAVDPGLTATAPGMEAMGARPVAEGAASIVWGALLPDDGPTGGFFRDGTPLPW